MLAVILVCATCSQESWNFFAVKTITPLTVSPSVQSTDRNNTSIATNFITVTPQKTNNIDVPPSELRGSIIHFWHTWSGPASEVIKSLIEDFNLHNEWGIIVVPVQQATVDEMSVNLMASMDTEEAPDLAIGFPHQYLEWDETKTLVDLRPYVDDGTWGLSLDEQGDFYPVIWEQDVLDGRRMGIPAQRSAQVLFYNQTWAKSLGFNDPPTSPEQFVEQACAAARLSRQDADPSNDGTGGYMISPNYAAMLSWIYSFGGEVIQLPEPGLGQSVFRFNTPEVEETFYFLRELSDQLCAWQPENQYPQEEFATRQGLFFTGNVMDIQSQVESFRQVGNRDRWTVIPFPSPTNTPAIDVYGISFVILPSTPERQLAAWMLIRFLVSPENQALLIEKNSALPLRLSSLGFLEKLQSQIPQWKAAVELLNSGSSRAPLPILGYGSLGINRRFYTTLPRLLQHRPGPGFD